MEITLIQTEIELAVQEYVLRQLTIKEGQTISVELRATRVPSGFTANISIIPAGAVASDVQWVRAPVVELPELPVYQAPTLVISPPVKTVDVPELVLTVVEEAPLDVPFDLAPALVLVEAVEAPTPVEAPAEETLVEIEAEVEIAVAEIVEAPLAPTPEPEVVAEPEPVVEVVPVVEPEVASVVQPIRPHGLFGNRNARTPAEVRALMAAESEQEDAPAEASIEPKKPAVSLFKNLRKPSNG